MAPCLTCHPPRFLYENRNESRYRFNKLFLGYKAPKSRRYFQDRPLLWPDGDIELLLLRDLGEGLPQTYIDHLSP